MCNELYIAILSLIGTLAGTFGGIMTSNRLTGYRIEQLEKKVEKHNNVVERVTLLEQGNKLQWDVLNDTKDTIDELKKEVYTLES
mgnify:CR=1 FL=1